MNIFEINDLKFKYAQSSQTVLDIPQLNIKQGQSVFLYGPSGSGKSTLLEILAAVATPLAGQIKILNQDMSVLSPSEKDQFRSKHIGYIFQQFNLIPYLSVAENINLPFLFNHKKKNEKTYSRLVSALNIKNIEHKNVNQLSIGQQQRVAAARALVFQPEIILADEPTSALDSDRRENFIKILFELSSEQNSTLVFVSHDMSLKPLFDTALDLIHLNKANNLESEL